ncbi:hypothetical protein Agub_g15760, partial [Astrephomene gubernaculifera]
MEDIGLLHVLVSAPPGCKSLNDFLFQDRLLTARNGDVNGDRVKLEPHGTRSAELLTAVARLQAIKRLAVTVRPLVVPAPEPRTSARPAAAATTLIASDAPESSAPSLSTAV